MKAISIREAEGQLGQLVAEACRGETIVLTDGDNRVTLAPRVLDLEEDSPELEAELLKAVNGPHSPYAGGIEGNRGPGVARTSRQTAEMKLSLHRAEEFNADFDQQYQLVSCDEAGEELA